MSKTQTVQSSTTSGSPRSTARASVTADQCELAAAAGRLWADRKAERLRGEIMAENWPDTWRPEWAEGSGFWDQKGDAQTLPTLMAIANHSAAERWRKLVVARRRREDAADEELDLEAFAASLFESVRDALPEGLRAVRDGERVYLTDESGMERTITSLEQTFRVVEEWKEKRSL